PTVAARRPRRASALGVSHATHHCVRATRDPAAGGFDDSQLTKLNPRERGESAATGGAEAPPADRRIVLGGTRVLHLCVFITAIWTTHPLSAPSQRGRTGLH